MEYFISAIMGLIVGAMVTVLIYSGVYLSPCEAELPRNQHCELIAVPKVKEE